MNSAKSFSHENHFYHIHAPMHFILWKIGLTRLQNGHIPLFGKIFNSILLFIKYLIIYHLFEIRVCRGTQVLLKKITFKVAVLFFMKLKFHQKISKEFKFVKLELHGKLEFHKLEF